MIQYFAPDITDTLLLPEDEARHCLKVCRTAVGDTATVVDGRGNRHVVSIVSDDPRHATVKIVATERVDRQWSTGITIGIAPTKNIDRIEWVLEKLTEIGIDSFVPVVCDRSERKIIKTERLTRIAVSAMKQSLKAILPDIKSLTPVMQFITDNATTPQRFIAYCDDTVERHTLARVYNPESGDVALLIGPEGDFSPREVKAAIEAGFIPVSLGPCRLRTETAAISAVDTIHIINMKEK